MKVLLRSAIVSFALILSSFEASASCLAEAAAFASFPVALRLGFARG